MKKLSFLAGIGTVLLAASGMQAVTISLQATEMGQPGMLTASSMTGVVSINNVSFNDFVFNSFTGNGTPFYNTPELNLQTVDVTSSSASGPHTLTIWVTETGLTSPKNLPVILADTGSLTGVTSETINAYYDTTDTAYGTQHLLGTTTYTTSGASATNMASLIAGVSGGPFSESEEIIATFAGPNDTLNSSAHIKSALAVPEPFSLGLIGAGLLGLGVLGYRRRKS